MLAYAPVIVQAVACLRLRKLIPTPALLIVQTKACIRFRKVTLTSARTIRNVRMYVIVAVSAKTIRNVYTLVLVVQSIVVKPSRPLTLEAIWGGMHAGAKAAVRPVMATHAQKKVKQPR